MPVFAPFVATQAQWTGEKAGWEDHCKAICHLPRLIAASPKVKQLHWCFPLSLNVFHSSFRLERPTQRHLGYSQFTEG